MMMSPGESSGISCSISSSTAGPALTIIITLRGLARFLTSSSSEWQPTNFLPLARPSMNSSTTLVVRLNTATLIAAAFDVEGQVLAHHGQADQTDITVLGHIADLDSSLDYGYDEIAVRLRSDSSVSASASCFPRRLLGQDSVELVEQLLLILAGERAGRGSGRCPRRRAAANWRLRAPGLIGKNKASLASAAL